MHTQELHFTQGHYPCCQPVCLVRKFVVFGSALDLKAHMVEEHGADMSSRDKKDARRIQAEFGFEEVPGGGRRGGRRDRGDREREREPPPSAPPRPNAAGARRREAFSGNLTTDNAPVTSSRIPSRQQTPSPGLDPAVAERHTAFLARVSLVASNPNNAIPAVKAAVRSYRTNESGARDLISTIWNISDRNLEGTAGVINSLVELLEDEDKKKDLLQAWNGFKIEQRNQFPELVPSGTGSEWAGITGGRLLNAKQTTASRSSAQSSRQVLDRVARAAASSSHAGSSTPPRAVSSTDMFPTLKATATVAGGSSRQGQRQTPWASSSAAAPAPAPVVRGPTSVPGPGAQTKTAPPNLTKAAFPELPMSATTRVPRAAVGGNQSLRKILGESAPPAPAWGAGGTGNTNGAATPQEGTNTESAAESSNRGKKGKGKQKQTLFTLGSFPT
ncbi:hypothetical protein PHLCEN_2v10450 [Hermanssonia centrifuga]|uniref:Uncharacterized protein n=1 Tax=Hermanssonia centrifuga TaxID=98765 RepID=A0A2R6NMY2_9APHY|nr:hypothetical protein PHLCEN_2v10450 [Hermanssonia centrifuga]